MTEDEEALLKQVTAISQGGQPLSVSKLRRLIRDVSLILLKEGEEDKQEEISGLLSHFFEEIFGLVNLLCTGLTFDATTDPDGIVRKLSKEALALVAKTANPKEVVMSLQIALQTIASEEPHTSNKWAEDDDEDQDNTSCTEGIAEDKNDAIYRRNSDIIIQVEEFDILLDMCSASLLRSISANPVKLISAANLSVLDTLQRLCRTIVYQDVADAPPSSYNPYKTILLAVIQYLVTLAENNNWSASRREPCYKSLHSFFFASLEALHGQFPEGIAHELFLKSNERYRTPKDSSTSESENTSTWAMIIKCAQTIGLWPSSSVSQHSTWNRPGELILAAHALYHDESHSQGKAANLGTITFVPLLLVCLKGFSASGTTDEGLYWLWRWFIEVKATGRKIDDTHIFELSEILGPLAVQSNGVFQLLLFKALSTLIVDLTESERVQMMLMKSLVEETPYINLRGAALGILREIVTKAAGTKKLHSLFMSPDLVTELGPSFMRFDSNASHFSTSSQSVPPPKTWNDLNELQEAYSKLTLDRLNFCYFLLVLDVGNKTGIRSCENLAILKTLLIDPVMRLLENAYAELEKEPGVTASQKSQNAQIRGELQLIEFRASKVIQLLRPSMK